MGSYTPAVLNNAQLDANHIGRDELVAMYYSLGYTINEIVGFLALRHSVPLSTRQGHRILRNLNMRRRLNEANIENIVRAILQEIAETGQNVGYRNMRRRLLTDHGLVATNDTVRIALSVLDSSGVMTRRMRRIRRRTYYNKGPNNVIHLDGWDKRKPYGISVHGCVDGFSRRLLWLDVCSSNKNPLYISSYFVRYIEEINGVPVLIYADRGTENSVVRDLQYALRWHHQDPFQGLSSFQYGSSIRNTRIERFWGCFRMMCGTFWINFFKDLADIGILDTSDNFHLECVRYCFVPVIRCYLERVIRHWNQHRIRPSRNAEVPAGIPDVLYFQPEIYGTRDYKLPLTGNIQEIKEQYTQNPEINITSTKFREVAEEILRRKNLNYPPRSKDEASTLFCAIILFVSELDHQ